MIQINLVPDVKQEMLRAQRMRNITISISILAGLMAGGAVVAMGLVLGGQAVTENVVASQIPGPLRLPHRQPSGRPVLIWI